MSPPPPPSILFLLLLLSLITPTFSQTCTTQKFTNKLYANCLDLPFLNSFLHWNYDPSNSSLSVAFLAAPAQPSGWVAWAINPNSTGMVGAQALVAFRGNNSAMTVKTFNIKSYLGPIPGKLSFDVRDLRAEESDGLMRIFAIVSVPEDAVSLNLVWQVGPSVTAGSLDKHDFSPDNLQARGELIFNGCSTLNGGICGNIISAWSPSPSPTPALLRPSPSQSPSPAPTPTSNKWNRKRKILIAVTGATIVGLFLCITIFYFRCKPSTWQGDFWLTTKSNQHIEAFLKNHGALTLRRYKFSDVKKMTNSFKVKLGQGGFGAVYKGKLLTGDPVAVKMLNASKGNGEEFINEVASISRTSHVNVVTLLGFCLEGRKKALIYEFMPNGSLEKFIYQKGPETTPSLSCDNLYQIALGIARGLEYLHRGCNTRILHFDIKPHNILLDENFCPKISDFGLAKLCPRKESIISMSDARGTIGYVAPEVWNRHFGGVSHKSDVYSYGMLLLEMVGARKNINAEASHTSEIYFPHWVYNRLEQGSDLRPDVVKDTEENEITKKMIVVGLWCIQTFPNDRPTMSGVIGMLEGSINSLEMPPKPILSSPTRSMPESSTT